MTKQSNCGEMLLFRGIHVKGTWEFVIQFFVQCCNFSLNLKYFQIISKKFRTLLFSTSYPIYRFRNCGTERQEGTGPRSYSW